MEEAEEEGEEGEENSFIESHVEKKMQNEIKVKGQRLNLNLFSSPSPSPSPVLLQETSWARPSAAWTLWSRCLTAAASRT